MSVEIGTIVTVVLAMIAGVYGYGRLSGRVESNEEAYKTETKETKEAVEAEHRNLWKVIGDVRKGLDDHLKDASQTRLELEKEMGSIRGNMSTLTVKLDTILDKVEDLKNIVQKAVLKQ